MELQSVLLIVGIIAIVAILLHGLFTIRQSKKPVDVSQLNLNESENEELDRDGSGFDCHGVGVARVIKVNDTQELNISPEPQSSVNTNDATPVQQNATIDFDVALEKSEDDTQPTISTAIDTDLDKETVPMFTSPIAKEKEGFLAVKTEEKHSSANQTSNDDEVTEPAIVEQIIEEPLLEEPIVQEPAFAEPTHTEETNNEPAKPSDEVMDVLVLNVVGENGDDIDGATLLPVLLTLGFKFGEMNIFHRHVDAAGQGAVLFSLANMVQPGHFDIDNMEQFSTKGISLFMTIPHKRGNMETFNTMLNASAKIAEEFNGQVLDGDRITLTNQSTQKYVQRIRQLERSL